MLVLISTSYHREIEINSDSAVISDIFLQRRPAFCLETSIFAFNLNR